MNEGFDSPTRYNFLKPASSAGFNFLKCCKGPKTRPISESTSHFIDIDLVYSSNTFFKLKFIRLTLFILYNYYKKGRWERAPIFHAAATLSLFVWMNIVAVLCFAGKCDLILKSKVYGLSILFLLTIVMYLFARNPKLIKLKYEVSPLKKARRLLVIYFIASFILLVVSFFAVTDENATLITPIK